MTEESATFVHPSECASDIPGYFPEQLQLTPRKDTLIIGYVSSSLHGTLMGITWMRATTLFSWTLAERRGNKCVELPRRPAAEKSLFVGG